MNISQTFDQAMFSPRKLCSMEVVSHVIYFGKCCSMNIMLVFFFFVLPTQIKAHVDKLQNKIKTNKRTYDKITFYK